MRLTCLGGVLLSLTSLSSAEINSELSVGYDSIYHFRGAKLGDDLVWIGVDVSTETECGWTIGGGLWYGSTEPEISGGGAVWVDDEIDFYGYAAKDIAIGSLEGSFEIGITHYNVTAFSATQARGLAIENTNEVYVKFGTTLGPVDLSASYIYDFDVFDAGYAEFTAGHETELSEKVSLAFEVVLGYDTGLYDVDDFTHGSASLALPIALSDTATLTPYIAYSDQFELGDEDYFFGGASLAVTF